MTDKTEVRIWAATGELVDPDLDVTHPGGIGGEGRYAEGWVVCKEPHEWANYIYNNVDSILAEIHSSGTYVWDSSVTYAKGAIVNHNGVLYCALRSNANVSPDLLGLDWDIVSKDTKALYEAFLAEFRAMLNSHLAEVGPTKNPHQTTITQAGGYTKAQVDAFLATLSDKLSNHANNKSNPHTVTLAQVGVLPTSGGNFTGTVTYSKLALALYGGFLDSVGLGRGSSTFGINNNLPMHISANREIVTDRSFEKVRRRYEPLFVVPTPDIDLPLTSSINTPTVGSFYVNYARPATTEFVDRSGATVTAAIDTPPFTEGGLKLTTDTSLLLSTLASSTLGTISYTLDGVVYVVDTAINSLELTDYIGKQGNVKDFKLWLKPLTTYQKSMLGG